VRRIRLVDRLAPYVREAPRGSTLLARRPPVAAAPSVDRLLRALAGRLDRLVGGAASVQRRLEQAASPLSLEQFRAEQVIWSGVGMLAGVALCVLLTARGNPVTPVAWLLLAVLGVAVGGVLRDRMLTRDVRRRQAVMLAEFPAVAELLALAVGAGESPRGALERLTRCSHGHLAAELSRTLADARAGVGLVEALERMAARTSLPALERFVDGMAVAIDRGTPLADVLRAQAADVREEGRRALLEAGGRKEIGMLVPVVFLILPVTVVVALFPGFVSLHLAVP
jgi:tight adherence protein C